ncbi:MAG: hypothetical protein M4579_003727 [Chaenotheca gracillima]|nr:MAG: hypothetical protein M4579_003727 [Chaenotheca gracillima]
MKTAFVLASLTLATMSAASPLVSRQDNYFGPGPNNAVCKAAPMTEVFFNAHCTQDFYCDEDAVYQRKSATCPQGSYCGGSNQGNEEDDARCAKQCYCSGPGPV